jgi:hypothetical protein
LRDTLHPSRATPFIDAHHTARIKEMPVTPRLPTIFLSLFGLLLSGQPLILFPKSNSE